MYLGKWLGHLLFGKVCNKNALMSIVLNGKMDMNGNRNQQFSSVILIMSYLRDSQEEI